MFQLPTPSSWKHYISATIATIAKQPTLQGQQMLWHMTIVHNDTSQTNNVSLISVFHFLLLICITLTELTMATVHPNCCQILLLHSSPPCKRSNKEQAISNKKQVTIDEWQATSNSLQSHSFYSYFYRTMVPHVPGNVHRVGWESQPTSQHCPHHQLSCDISLQSTHREYHPEQAEN